MISRYWTSVGSEMMHSVLAGSGLYAVFSLGGIMFLGFPTIMKAVAYTFAVLHTSLSWWLASVCAIVAGMLFAFVFSKLLVSLSLDSFAVVGLASIVAFEAWASSSEITNGTLGISIVVPAVLRNATNMLILSVSLALIFCIVFWGLMKTPFGRKLRAYKENTYALEALGVSAHSIASRVLMYASFCVSVSALLQTWSIGVVSPSLFGVTYLITMLSLVILAFTPSVFALIGAAVIVRGLPEVLGFIDFPPASFAHIEIIVYSTIVIIMIRMFGSVFLPEKRSI